MAEKSSRILILTTSYLPSIGGSELAIYEITKRLPDFEFDIITSRSDSEGRFDPARASQETHGNSHIYRVGGPVTLSPFLLPKNFLPLSILFKALSLNSKHHYRAIHAYQASQAAGAAWLFKFFYPRVKFILTIQEGKDLKRQGSFMNFFRNSIIRSADIITVISRYLEDYVSGINRQAKMFLIPNGVDSSKFSIFPHEERAGNFQFSNKERKEKNIITVSRLVEKNGLLDLVDAMALVKKEEPTAKLVIIGKGPLEESLKIKAKSLKLEDSVRMVGEVSHDELPRYLSNADIFIRPSLSEGLGTAFLEAMAASLAVVATPVGGIPDFLKDGETGLFCQPKDPADIASKLIKLMREPELRQRLAENGRKLVAEKYNWDNITAQFSMIYHEK